MSHTRTRLCRLLITFIFQHTIRISHVVRSYLASEAKKYSMLRSLPVTAKSVDVGSVINNGGENTPRKSKQFNEYRR
jgi:hypothetical protein